MIQKWGCDISSTDAKVTYIHTIHRDYRERKFLWGLMPYSVETHAEYIAVTLQKPPLVAYGLVPDFFCTTRACMIVFPSWEKFEECLWSILCFRRKTLNNDRRVEAANA
jgi:hypothetical protein